MICPCGGMTRDHETIAGRVYTCNFCGRRELFPWKTQDEADARRRRAQLNELYHLARIDIVKATE